MYFPQVSISRVKLQPGSLTPAQAEAEANTCVRTAPLSIQTSLLLSTPRAPVRTIPPASPRSTLPAASPFATVAAAGIFYLCACVVLVNTSPVTMLMFLLALLVVVVLGWLLIALGIVLLLVAVGLAAVLYVVDDVLARFGGTRWRVETERAVSGDGASQLPVGGSG